MRFVIKIKQASDYLDKALQPLRGRYQALSFKRDQHQEIKLGFSEPIADAHLSEHKIVYGKIFIGDMKIWSADKEIAQEIALLSAPALFPLILDEDKSSKLFQYFDQTLDWIDAAKSLAPELCDWIGIYFQASHLTQAGSDQKLWVGPYRGEATEHIEIPVQSGLCGLAFRERRIVNMADVHADSRHIACSLKTQSELILPLYNQAGEMVAELDIDSWTKAAFTPAIEALFVDYAKSFRPLT